MAKHPIPGGLGILLGSSAPKGCYDIGMPSGKSLFQYHARRLVSARRLAAHAGVDETEVRLPFLTVALLFAVVGIALISEAQAMGVLWDLSVPFPSSAFR